MPAHNEKTAAGSAAWEPSPAGLVFVVSGNWSLGGQPDPWPSWEAELRRRPAGRLELRADGLGSWDSALVSLLHATRATALALGWEVDAAALPQAVRGFLDLVDRARPAAAASPAPSKASPIERLGHPVVAAWHGFWELSAFIGECVFALVRLLAGRSRMRWADLIRATAAAGAEALGIVGLITFLVGVILAFQGAVQLSKFGAGIYVANGVALAMVREMGPIMVGVMLAGRTGAAFAATLGTMQANEEVDALRTTGLSPIDFLVLPRLLALMAMTPLLALYANFIGIAGGMAVATSLLDLPASLYLRQTLQALSLADLFGGLAKSMVFGALVAGVSCLRGLSAGRNAEGVGVAVTHAVVQGITLIVVADAVLAVLYHLLGL